MFTNTEALLIWVIKWHLSIKEPVLASIDLFRTKGSFSENLSSLKIHILLQIVKVSTGDRIRITNFVPPSSGFAVRVLTGEVRLVSASKARPGSSLELNAVDLSSHLLSRYADQLSDSFCLHKITLYHIALGSCTVYLKPWESEVVI